MASIEKINQSKRLSELYRKYNGNCYVFKKCVITLFKTAQTKKWIVIMKKMHDTITNESRKNIIDRNYGSYRANKLIVQEIVNVDNMNVTIKKVTNVFRGKKTVYECGKIVSVNDYDMNLEKICSPGIHYFKNLFQAYFFGDDLPKKYTGKYYAFCNNGGKRLKCEYVNGILEGKYTEWYEFRKGNGNKMVECEYVNGMFNGKFCTYYENGKKNIDCEYINGKLEGKYIKYHKNGELLSEREYSNGVLNYKITF